MDTNAQDATQADIPEEWAWSPSSALGQGDDWATSPMTTLWPLQRTVQMQTVSILPSSLSQGTP